MNAQARQEALELITTHTNTNKNTYTNKNANTNPNPKSNPTTPKTKPKPDIFLIWTPFSYAGEAGDRLHMEAFYDNYCNPETVAGGTVSGTVQKSKRRNYPVVCLNYHKMWDNREAVVRALGLPAGEASKVRRRRR